jgi:hypothetical protein
MQTATRSQLNHSTSVLTEGRVKPMISSDYVVGLTDGEGCFYVSLRKPVSKKAHTRVELNFYIKLQEQDREILEKVKDVLSCGAVYFQHETRANHTQCYRYTVSSHRDILGKIIPFFRRNQLQTDSKQRNFEVFCKIAEIVQFGLHQTEDGISRIQKLKSKMNHRTRVVREIRTLRGNSK